MKYDVKEAFSYNIGKPDPVEVEAGTVFIPAETNVPQNIVDSLVLAGKIVLIKPERQESDVKPKKHK